MQFDRGYISPYFITNAEKMVAELESPYILIYEKKLSGLQPLLPARAGGAIGQAVAHRCRGRGGRGARHTRGQQAARRVEGRGSQGAGFGDRRKAMLQDIAVLTGGELISEDLGIKLENVTVQMLARPRG
jgi:chaperonin GroEL